MRKKNLWIVFPMLFVQVAYAKNPPEHLAMRLIGVSRKLSAVSSEPSGFAILRFQNERSEPIRIHFIEMCGQSYFETRQDHSGWKPYFSLAQDHESVAGSAAVFDYEWKNRDGSTVSMATYEVSRPPCLMNVGEQCVVYLPIALPKKSGAYTLTVRFDNTFLAPILHSRGKCSSIDWNGCFKATDRVDVDLKIDQDDVP